jgi:polar amino acid transport system ATP-binding protein
MIIISHSIGFLEGVSDHILYMEGGLVVEHGPTAAVLNSPKDARVKDFIAQAE